MSYKYNGPFNYNEGQIKNWESSEKGVYYIGILENKKLKPFYIGKATGNEGIRGRLLDHLNNNSSDCTHFGYTVINNDQEALAFEKSEIKEYNPKYNNQHR